MLDKSTNTSVPKIQEPIVKIINGQARTTSLYIAKHFGKQHKDVLKAIRNLEVPEDFRRRNFAPCEIIRDIPLQGEKPMPYYNITRDGFTVLAMGFTGKEAMRFKIAYIEEFNRMEAQIKEQLHKSQLPLFSLSPLEEPLSNSQRKSLDLLVSTWSACSRIGKPRAWQKIHRHFGTKTIADFKLSQLSEVIQWIQERINIAIASGGLDWLDPAIFDPRRLIESPVGKKAVN